jgi:Fe(3+) dicitrate transport protein
MAMILQQMPSDIRMLIFTPPTEAMDRIEIVRGAASLQFGTQFGGLINFKTHQPVAKKFQLTSQTTAGSFATVSAYNAIEGTYKKLSYFAYYQYKFTKGWRPNSRLNAHTAFANISYQITTKLKLSAEFTHQNYVMQQPGGLTDNQFNQNPKQSTRERNWFGINWNIPFFKTGIPAKRKHTLEHGFIWINRIQKCTGLFKLC